MKTIIVLVWAIAASLAFPKSNFLVKWDNFKITHNKKYSSSSEELKRMIIFKDNLEEIEKHNAKFAKNEVTYKKKINQFGDWTKEEFLEYVNNGKVAIAKPNKKLGLPWTPSNKPKADSVDWRDIAVTEVKNQGQCGACWSFSVTGAVEGQLAINGDGLVSLSEQNLIDCSGDYGNAGCSGGFMDAGFEYIKNYGIMKESDYPYQNGEHECKFDPSKSVTTLSGYYDLPAGNESALEDAVANIGPIAVGIDATYHLQFYAQGILYDESCDPDVINHGVLAVGYGSENGTDYWIVKNSWGQNWGEKGYFRLIRNNNNNCNVASIASYPVL